MYADGNINSNCISLFTGIIQYLHGCPRGEDDPKTERWNVFFLALSQSALFILEKPKGLPKRNCGETHTGYPWEWIQKKYNLTLFTFSKYLLIKFKTLLIFPRQKNHHQIHESKTFPEEICIFF